MAPRKNLSSICPGCAASSGSISAEASRNNANCSCGQGVYFAPMAVNAARNARYTGSALSAACCVLRRSPLVYEALRTSAVKNMNRSALSVNCSSPGEAYWACSASVTKASRLFCASVTKDR